MKRFTDNFRKVLDGLTTPGAPQSPSKPESEIAESLASEHFQVSKTVRHGFPHQPTALAFDPVQKILAVGTHGGALRVFGRPGVDCFCQHENGVEVTQLMFMVNEGALISRCSDDSLHLWNLRQKQPAVLHSLKFHKESIGCAHLPFQSKWLYIGTKKGNIHVVNVECFQLSGYVIMWNRAIELSTKAHPGSIVHISDNPVDEGKLLIGYERGTVVLWDLKSKKADFRYYYEEEIHSVSWHHEGKQFVCSHSDGSLTTWNVRSPARPTGLVVPHKKPFKEGRKVDVCGPILKVEHKTCRTAEPFTIFSGGLVEGKAKRSSLSVMHGRNITVLEMDSNIVDFLTLCETPYPSDFQDPYAVVVLLEKDMVVVDLTQSGYPIFENPYAMDIHDSPVTFCEYFADCSVEIIPALYSVGARQKKQGFSKQEWPISGGSWDIGNQSYPEVIITGHADGSLKFWDASAITLQLLYKLRTAKIFERPVAAGVAVRDVGKGGGIVPSPAPAAVTVDEPEDPFAVQLLAWCPESRMLCVAGASSHVVFYRFSRQEAVGEIAVLEVRMQPEPEGAETPDPDAVIATVSSSLSSSSTTSAAAAASGAATSSSSSSTFPSSSLPPPPAPSGPGPGLPASSSQLPYPRGHPSSASTGSGDGAVPSLRVKSEAVRQSPGYQAELVVQLVWADGETSQLPTSLEVSSAYGLVALGTCSGLVVVDVLQRSILLSLSCLDLYGSSDPYQRQPKSPRKSKQLAAGLADITEGIGAPDTERSRSPSSVRSRRWSFVYLTVKRHRKLSLPSDLKTSIVVLQKSYQNSKRDDVIDTDQLNGVCTSPTAVQQSRSPAKRLAPSEAPKAKSRGPVRPPFRKAMSAACMEVSAPAAPANGEGASKSFHIGVGASTPAATTATTHGGRRAMLQQLHSFSIFSHDDHQASGYAWNGRETRDNSLGQSRSSSVCSIDKESRESVTALRFSESFARKGDGSTCPCLWVGTSLGTVLSVGLSLPPSSEQRLSQPVIISPSGTVTLLKGPVLRVDFLDCGGALARRPHEAWRDTNSHSDERDERGERARRRRPQSVTPSASAQELGAATQYVVACSEKQAKVVALPAQSCVYKHNITETSFVLRADAVAIGASACLASFCANGHIIIFSLPSLRPLLDVNFLPLADLRAARTFCFSNGGQALYLCSPTEIQRITYSQEMCESLQDMLGELFIPVQTPEAPNKGFFKGFFGGNSPSLDREELFGETGSGRASRSLAQHIPGHGSGSEGVKAAAGGVAAEMSRARLALDERGQRLGDLEDRTAAMLSGAENFSKHAHEMMLKTKDKKWYQL
ncbi:syntaxin-binding protein 5-like isoform X2 [Petromyzon marinus]|uniref:Syntaxin-binding protein 5-like n=1 Tax=Petromyzon marinus TaxID=7757 RepID=A0AAJ7UDA2_PETMA|nr:syntaxin-binding protein 5-like isoform X2 [Petromyzon marinus]